MVFAIENGSKYDIKYVYNQIIKGGSLDCIKYIYEKHGDKYTMLIDEIQYIIQNYNKYKDVIFYLAAKKSKIFNYDKIYEYATIYDRRKLIKYLERCVF